MLPHDYDPDDGIGVRHDVLMDGHIELENAVHVLSDINVSLDSLADDPAYWTDDELAELRSIQQSIQRLHDEKESDREETHEKWMEAGEELRDARE